MRGVLLISHGALAAGMISSFTMLCGDHPHLVAVSLEPNDSADSFADKLRQADISLSDCDHVVVFADIMGGSPCKIALVEFLHNPLYSLVTGMSLPMVMDAVLGDSDTNELIETGRASILDVKAKYAQLAIEDDDDDD